MSTLMKNHFPNFRVSFIAQPWPFAKTSPLGEDVVIQGAPHGFKDIRREDALAMGDYLKSIRAIKNKIK